MKINRYCLYYIILLLICLVGVVLPARALDLQEGEEAAKVTLSKTQEAAIVDHCATIKESLKTVQKSDARARVYLGGRYETILNKYITPLNVRLVENSLSTTSLIESQNTLASSKAKFANDYVDYQQKLEELVAVDCKNNPTEFYEKLDGVRQKRKKVEQDVQKMRRVLAEYVDSVGKVKEKLNAKTK